MMQLIVCFCVKKSSLVLIPSQQSIRCKLSAAMYFLFFFNTSPDLEANYLYKIPTHHLVGCFSMDGFKLFKYGGMKEITAAEFKILDPAKIFFPNGSSPMTPFLEFGKNIAYIRKADEFSSDPDEFKPSTIIAEIVVSASNFIAHSTFEDDAEAIHEALFDLPTLFSTFSFNATSLSFKLHPNFKMRLIFILEVFDHAMHAFFEGLGPGSCHICSLWKKFYFLFPFRGTLVNTESRPGLLETLKVHFLYY